MKLLILLMFVVGGCCDSMTANEIAREAEKCKDAGLVVKTWNNKCNNGIVHTTCQRNPCE